MKRIFYCIISVFLLAVSGISVFFILNIKKQKVSESTTISETIVEEKKVEPVKNQYYTGSLISEFEENNCHVQERYLTENYKFYHIADLERYREDKENIPKVFDTVENRNCIYNIQDGETVNLHAFRKYYNHETQEISYWLKITVNEIEGWFFLYTTTKPNPLFFEEDFWVPYKQTFIENDKPEDIWIRKINSGACLERYSSFLPSPHSKADYIIGIDEQIYDDLNSSVYVSVIAMTVENDEYPPKYSKMLIEKNGIQVWVEASRLGYGESGGPLLRGPLSEINRLLYGGA